MDPSEGSELPTLCLLINLQPLANGALRSLVKGAVRPSGTSSDYVQNMVGFLGVDLMNYFGRMNKNSIPLSH